nr:aminoglycoside adenylyltransferase domain-containing protein [Actinopolymorpha cephalotaxi]
MPTAIHLDAAAESGFWYVLDRAIAHRSGVAISGPPAREIFADVPRHTLLDAMYESMTWHRAHEKATLYSVLNACRAWRFAEDDVLGSKLEGAAWARARWSDTGVIDAAVALRRGEDAALADSAVDALLAAVATRLSDATRG